MYVNLMLLLLQLLPHFLSHYVVEHELVEDFIKVPLFQWVF